VSIGSLDDAFVSAGSIDAETAIAEPGLPPVHAATGRAKVAVPGVGASSLSKGARSATVHGSPKYSLTGGATYYDNGTTAMRLPRGTVVKICGDGGCIVRVVNDYGPQKKTRIVDLYRPDFFAVCGCPSYAGNTKVTVYVY
jgi:3D (Asp-Asp-Asp) domain-containing protein